MRSCARRTTPRNCCTTTTSELGLDPAAIKLDTLRVDIAAELENRGKLARPATPAVDGTRAGA
jgi:hypothetical protein